MADEERSFVELTAWLSEMENTEYVRSLNKNEPEREIFLWEYRSTWTKSPWLDACNRKPKAELLQFIQGAWKILLTTAGMKGIVEILTEIIKFNPRSKSLPVWECGLKWYKTLGVHIAETLPSLLEPDNTGVRKQYENMDTLDLLRAFTLHGAASYGL